MSSMIIVMKQGATDEQLVSGEDGEGHGADGCRGGDLFRWLAACARPEHAEGVDAAVVAAPWSLTLRIDGAALIGDENSRGLPREAPLVGEIGDDADLRSRL